MPKFAKSQIAAIAAAMHSERPVGRIDFDNLGERAVCDQHWSDCRSLATAIGIVGAPELQAFMVACGTTNTFGCSGQTTLA